MLNRVHFFSSFYIVPKFSLGNHFDNFVAQSITEGRYGNASEVIRAGLRLLENEENKIKNLRAAIQEG